MLEAILLRYLTGNTDRLSRGCPVDVARAIDRSQVYNASSQALLHVFTSGWPRGVSLMASPLNCARNSHLRAVGKRVVIFQERKLLLALRHSRGDMAVKSHGDMHRR